MEFIILIIIGVIILLGGSSYAAWKHSPKMIGKRGEQFIHDVLVHLTEDYIVLDDVLLETPKGTTQIDHVVVSKYGVFVVETKNYRGEIYGNDNRDEWTQIILTDVTYSRKWYKTYTYVTKNTLYNPVRQALGHAYALQKVLKEWKHLPIVPIVVFTGKADLSHVESAHHVLDVDDLIPTILSYNTMYLSESAMQEVAKLITQSDRRKVVNDRTHILNVRAARQAHEEKIESGVCPRCGGQLVLRHGKYGDFYGCMNYPKCKYTLNVNW